MHPVHLRPVHHRPHDLVIGQHHARQRGTQRPRQLRPRQLYDADERERQLRARQGVIEPAANDGRQQPREAVRVDAAGPGDAARAGQQLGDAGVEGVGGEGSDVMNGATDDRPDGVSADLILGLQAPSDRSDVIGSGQGSDIMNGGDCAGDDVLDDRLKRSP